MRQGDNMKMLSQNSKIKKSQNETWDIFNFGIPAFRSETGLNTCPMAGNCANGCYAQSGTYRFGNVRNAYEERLKLTQSEHFCTIMTHEITAQTFKTRAKNKSCLIRIHDSGDFYSNEYANNWLKIIQQCQTTQFYAYTKMVQMFENLKDSHSLPPNLKLIYSYGGKQDYLIDQQNHRHSRVFQDETSLIEAGYANASQNDLVAIGDNNKIGLTYHGSKNYAKTNWSKV